MLLLITSFALLASAMPSADTVAVSTSVQAPVLDGRVREREYNAPAFRITTAAGDVRVWLARHDGFLYIAATIPDSSFYWGDDFVISLAPNGRGEPVLDVGDRQWYLRRTLDSSVVAVVSDKSSGRWYAPGQEPPALGAARHTAEWDVAATSTADGWSIELRVRESVVHPGAAAPRLAIRTYNSGPRGWWSWPAPPADIPAQRVERTPSLWIPLKFQ